ncbi:multidrug effflux MFS transporter [Vibrio profundum]|uniref:multidrug effflux MFS transporter n=1 Tax=Vibrio profundum TaxID=2910247 RepID=UPI003D0B359D
MNTTSLLRKVLVLAPFVFTFAFALDIYVPSLPSLPGYFHTSPFAVQLTVSAFLLLTGIGQLFAGPIADSIGRRKVALVGTATFLAGSIIAVFAPNIETLIAARMIEGFGACAMMVATFAMVRDLFDGNTIAKVYSYLNAGVALSPLLAPSIGGYMEKFYDWRATFVFLSVMSALILLLGIFKTKETLTEENRVPLSRKVFKDYLHIVKSNHFKLFALSASAGFSCFMIFISVSSYLLISILNVPVEQFGIWFGLIGIVFFIGSLISGYAASKIGAFGTVVIGALLVALSGLGMLGWYLVAGLSISSFIVPMMTMGIGGSMMMGAGAGGAIEPYPTMAGAASAVFGFFQFTIAFAVSTFVLQFEVTSTEPLAIAQITLGSAILLFSLAIKFSRKSSHTLGSEVTSS